MSVASRREDELCGLPPHTDRAAAMCTDLWYLCAAVAVIAASLWALGILCRGQSDLPAAGRPVLITGCDTGIGRRLAFHFSDLGCKVFAGCLWPEKAELPLEVVAIPLDVTRRESVEAAVASLTEKLKDEEEKGLWALINNAGVCVFGEFDWLTWGHCSRQIEVNLMGTIRVTKAFLPLIRRSKGRVVNITSVNGSVAYPGLSVYCATKFGLEGFSDALRRELHQFGVNVSVIQPGDFARLTSIMGAHKVHAEEMWQAMTEDDRDFYGSYFHRYHENAIKNYGITSPPSFEASRLLGDVEHAVLSDHPAARYISAPWTFRLFYQLLALLPVSYTDRLIETLIKLVFK